MEQREAAICQWFDMWLTKRDTGIRDLFAPDAVYIESWGPEYHGADKIAWWFTEWNRRGTVSGGISASSSTRGTRRWWSGPSPTGWTTAAGRCSRV